MKKLFLSLIVLLLAAPLLPAQKQLKNFDALMEALNGGAPVRLTIHYGQCKLIVDGEEQEKSVNAVGGMGLDVYE